MEDLSCLAAGVPQCLIIFLTHVILQAYTCSHYTCPICSKSLGDMAVSSAQPHDFVFLPPIWKLFLVIICKQVSGPKIQGVVYVMVSVLVLSSVRLIDPLGAWSLYSFIHLMQLWCVHG
jgi:hypothetical protein